MAASHFVLPLRNTGSSRARTGHSAAAGTGARRASVMASSVALTPTSLAASSCGHADSTPYTAAMSTTPKRARGSHSRRRALPTWSMALACTMDAPSRCKARVEKRIQREPPRCQPCTEPPLPCRSTLKMSVLSKMASCTRSSLACTSWRRVTGAGKRNCTSAGVKARALRSPPNSHHRAADRSRTALAMGTTTSVSTSAANGPSLSWAFRKSAHQRYSTPMTTAAR